MAWRLVALVAFLPFAVAQAAHTQGGTPQPSCAVACKANPFTAPAGCDCSAPGGGKVAPEPADPVPQTQPAPPIVSQPAPPPASAESGVPSCEVACKANPFTAPASCDCNALTGVGGTGGGAPVAGSPTSPESIAEDGVVEIRELLDYMEQLYLARIAGVQHYYFFERMVVAQPQQAARSPQPAPRLMLASTAQSPAAPQGGMTGINTLVPVARNFKKVEEDGRPAIKPVTRREVNEWAVKNSPAMARGTADERRAAEALAKDPSLFFEALGEVADRLAGKGAGAALKAEQKKMAASLAHEEREAEEDSIAEDVLYELQELKRLLDAQAEQEAATEAQQDEPEGFFDKAKEAYTGGKQKTVRSSVFVGGYRRGGGKLTFILDSRRCANQTGCTLREIAQFMARHYGDSDPDNPDEDYIDEYCLVWRPHQNAMAALGTGTLADATQAELWFQIGAALKSLVEIVMQMDGQGWDFDKALEKVEGAKGKVQKLWEHDEVDRVIRMRAVLATPTNAGFLVRPINRVYLDFRPVETGAGPPMVEPHEIREELGAWVCGEKADIADVLDPDNIFSGLLDGSDTCAAKLPLAVVSRFRSRFTYNQGFATAEEEHRAITEELGDLPASAPGLQPDKPEPPCQAGILCNE